MRFLLVSEVPLVRELGAGRVQLETAEELRRQGHEVTTFGPEDAFHRPRRRRSHHIRPFEFAHRARAFVREQAAEFDVIDALQGTLPFSKQDLRFDGLLVSRSVGLNPIYFEYLKLERKRWPELLPGSRPSQMLHRWYQRRVLQACLRSYRVSDVVRVLNDDERVYVDEVLGLGSKVVQLAEGLPDDHVHDLRVAACPAQERLQNREIVALGSWCLRKGRADWNEIVRKTRAAVPGARFSFLGTGVPEQDVLRDFEPEQRGAVTVKPQFDSDDLPQLLARATAGALPTYAEGYPLAIVEQCAAGVPAVAYATSGPGSVLRSHPELLVACGDAEEFAARLVRLLSLTTDAYATLSKSCAEIGDRHRLSVSVGELCEIYEHRLGEDSGRSAAPTARRSVSSEAAVDPAEHSVAG